MSKQEKKLSTLEFFGAAAIVFIIVLCLGYLYGKGMSLAGDVPLCDGEMFWAQYVDHIDGYKVLICNTNR